MLCFHYSLRLVHFSPNYCTRPYMLITTVSKVLLNICPLMLRKRCLLLLLHILFLLLLKIYLLLLFLRKLFIFLCRT